MSMTLIQDGNQIKSKMLDTGLLLNFVPKDWREAENVAKEGNENPLALQTLNKVFMFNNLGTKTYKNMWDFVREGEAPLFMGVNSELVGKNFLYMMTNEKYATIAKEAYEAWDGKNSEDDDLIESMKADAEDLGLTGANVEYGLAWVYLWCEKYNEQTDEDEVAADETNLDPDLMAGRKTPPKKVKAKVDDDGYLAFSIPWSLTLSYGISMYEDRTKKINVHRMRYPYSFTQTFNCSGFVRLADGWNITFTSGYDFNNHEISMTTASLSRDLHCFEMSCSVVLRPYSSFNFSFRARANELADALKWDKRSSYSTNIDWY